LQFSRHFPWIEFCIALPLSGAAWVACDRDPFRARNTCIVFSTLTCIAATAAWLDFQWLRASDAGDWWNLLPWQSAGRVFAIDGFSAPLLPLVSLVFVLTCIATVRSKMARFSFARGLLLESIVLATVACNVPWVIVALLSIGTLLPAIELSQRRTSLRAYGAYMTLFIVLAVWGQFEIDRRNAPQEHSWAVAILAIAMLIRGGIVPFHSWIPDLFDRGTFGATILFVTPLLGVYGLMRLIVPIASESLLGVVGMVAICTALYGAAQALVQNQGRRFFSYLVISQGGLVIAGMLTLAPVALTGALCVVLSATISLCGLGLTLRALEARRGPLCLSRFQGLYERTPNLAMCYVLTALASVGFPGTFGFIGLELLIDGAVNAHPLVGIALVVATALNGIAAMRGYFLLFGGTPAISSTSLEIRTRERFAVLVLAGLILLGGIVPHPFVASLDRATEEILQLRRLSRPMKPPLHSRVDDSR
jgi:NADH-quinone oxidoreductase subunit M